MGICDFYTGQMVRIIFPPEIKGCIGTVIGFKGLILRTVIMVNIVGDGEYAFDAGDIEPMSNKLEWQKVGF